MGWRHVRIAALASAALFVALWFVTACSFSKDEAGESNGALVDGGARTRYSGTELFPKKAGAKKNLLPNRRPYAVRLVDGAYVLQIDVPAGRELDPTRTVRLAYRMFKPGYRAPGASMPTDYLPLTGRNWELRVDTNRIVFTAATLDRKQGKVASGSGSHRSQEAYDNRAEAWVELVNPFEWNDTPSTSAALYEAIPPGKAESTPDGVYMTEHWIDSFTLGDPRFEVWAYLKPLARDAGPDASNASDAGGADEVEADAGDLDDASTNGGTPVVPSAATNADAGSIPVLPPAVQGSTLWQCPSGTLAGGTMEKLPDEGDVKRTLTLDTIVSSGPVGVFDAIPLRTRVVEDCDRMGNCRIKRLTPDASRRMHVAGAPSDANGDVWCYNAPAREIIFRPGLGRSNDGIPHAFEVTYYELETP